MEMNRLEEVGLTALQTLHRIGRIIPIPEYYPKRP